MQVQEKKNRNVEEMTDSHWFLHRYISEYEPRWLCTPLRKLWLNRWKRTVQFTRRHMTHWRVNIQTVFCSSQGRSKILFSSLQQMVEKGFWHFHIFIFHLSTDNPFKVHKRACQGLYRYDMIVFSCELRENYCRTSRFKCFITPAWLIALILHLFYVFIGAISGCGKRESEVGAYICKFIQLRVADVHHQRTERVRMGNSSTLMALLLQVSSNRIFLVIMISVCEITSLIVCVIF